MRAPPFNHDTYLRAAPNNSPASINSSEIPRLWNSSALPGDGNRVAKTVGGVTTKYLVDDLNPTGYAQVVEEIVNGSVQRVYTYGNYLINQNQLIGGNWTTTFYGYDGHGSARFLTDANGAITDRYDYDAFGNLISSSGSTPNNYLYSGEQYDADVGGYYLRARYYSQQRGRFLSMDSFQGQEDDPVTLHKYLYANVDPANLSDPTGLAATAEYAVENRHGEEVAAAPSSRELARQVVCVFVKTGSELVQDPFWAITIGLAEFALCRCSPKGGPAGPLRFSQKTARPDFTPKGNFGGSTIGEIAEALRRGALSPSQVPVRFIEREGVRLIVNTRSALALMRANIPQDLWTLLNRTGNPGIEDAITGRLLRNGLTNRGTDVLRITGLGRLASCLR